MAKLGKRTVAARKAFEARHELTVEEAVKLVKKNANAKFDETIEIAMQLGVDPRHADQMVRGVVSLPNGTGKTVRVAVFARGSKADEAKAAGADIVGAEDLMETIQRGTIDFDRCIATPDMMPIVGRLGKVLGPRNLMPNPKVGTVTMDVAKAVKAAKGGEVQFKTEKAGVVHAGVGKASFDEAKLVQNVRAFVDAVAKAKPRGAKGAYMRKISVSSTMGHGVLIAAADLMGRQKSSAPSGGPAFVCRTSWMKEDSEADSERLIAKALTEFFTVGGSEKGWTWAEPWSAVDEGVSSQHNEAASHRQRFRVLTGPTSENSDEKHQST